MTSAPAARMRSVRVAGVMVAQSSNMTPEEQIMIVLVLVVAIWSGMHTTMETTNPRVPGVDFGPASGQFLESR